MVENKIKILIVGSWISAVYEEPLLQAMQQLGHQVSSFKWGPYFKFIPLSNQYDVKNSVWQSLYYRIQNKYIWGPVIKKINDELIRKCNEEKPEVLFLYRATHIWPTTIAKIKNQKCKIFIYNNDDPFNSKLPSYIYRFFKKSLSLADWIFSYREKNITDYQKLGYSNCSLLLSNYIKTQNYPIDNMSKDYDVIFIGHFENDGRDEKILTLAKQANLKVGLWGLDWEASSLFEQIRECVENEIKPLYGEDYNQTINRSKIALVFLSKINNDGYTRRCFEIPATKTFMLCERQQEVQALFHEGIEADYFTTSEELLNKILYYIDNEDKRKKVAEAGYERLIQDGHEIQDRAKQIIENYYLLKN